MHTFLSLEKDPSLSISLERNRWIIRVFDLITSGIGLTLTAPLFGVVAFLDPQITPVK